jgi:hypothetical protein
VTTDFPFDVLTGGEILYELTDTPIEVTYFESQGFGLGTFVWHSSFQTEEDSEGFYHSQGFRFIGQQENDYNRWSAGDTIDLFSMDLYNQEFTDNAGHELAGAVELTVASAALIASVLLM